MAQWQELQNIDSEHQKEVIQVYAHQNFPWELRRFVSFWIEAQHWELVALDERHARDSYDELLRQVEARYSHLVQQNSLLDGPDYLQLVNNARALFQADPVNMARIISRCLSEERRIITSARTNLQECQIWLDDSIIELQKKIQMADLDIKSIDEGLGQRDFVLKAWQDEVEQLNGSPVSPQLQTRKNNIDQMLKALTQARLEVCHWIGNTLKLAELVVSRVVDEELRSWQLRQQQACIGAPCDTSLHKLQTWFEATVLALNLQLQQLRKLPELDLQSQPSETLLSQCEQTAQCLLRKLLKNALVVEKQPIGSTLRPLILKTGVRFSVKTRFLVNLSSFNWMPKVTLIFNKDFHEIGEVNGFRKFNFTQKVVSKLMVATEKTGLVAQFERLTLVEEKYKTNRHNESLVAVTEELHFITCVMELKLPDLQTLAVETSTLPLVVISSTNQGHAAWASILWSAMAADHQPKNLLFRSPPPVTWQQLSEVLSWQFQAMSNRGLDEQQLAMLRDKFVDEHVGLVTWNKFYKCDATWVWIEGILSLIKNHLLAIWRDGHIMGFISRDSATVLLQDKPSGTFLLRFSESQEGAITFSWVDRSTGVARVHAVEPYKKELSNENMAVILRNYRLRDPSSRTVNPLLYLYPDIPRDHAFGQYYTKPAENTDGYVPRYSGHWSVHPTPPPSPEENHSIDSVLNDMDLSPNNMDPSLNNMDPSLNNMDSSLNNVDHSIALELFPGLSGMGGPFPQDASPFTNEPLADGDWADQCDLSLWL